MSRSQLLERATLRDCLEYAHDMAKDCGRGMVGYGTAALYDGDGKLVQVEPFANLITDYGDLYYATMAIALVSPSNTAQPTKVTGMQIGSGGATAAAKAGAGGALVSAILSG